MGVRIVQRVVEHEDNRSLDHIVNFGRARAADFERTGTVGVGDRQARHRITRRLLQIARQRRVARSVMQPHDHLEQPCHLNRPLIHPALDLADLTGGLGL